ncbi:MAG: YkgJ family cysteine cluster protein [Clostridiaceae bacterium]|nr:YkgJ family cysteine cluster protein [Clostridiaceae bacterium]
MYINNYNCKMCGECCRKVPCELVPNDIPKLLKKFNMSFKEFFKKYLIAVPSMCGEKPDVILRLSPVRKINGRRIECFLANDEYMQSIDKGGECIFLSDNKCLIHEVKPLGGRIMLCPKMTNGLNFQLTDSQYYVYWYNNQQIFWELSKKTKEILIVARSIYSQAYTAFKDYCFSNDNSFLEQYKQLVSKAEKMIKKDLAIELLNL